MTITVEKMLERLVTARSNLRITQRVAAKRIGIAQAYLANLETKKNAPPTWQMLARMCEIYDVDPAWVMGMREKLNIPPSAYALFDMFDRLSPKRRRDIMDIIQLWLSKEQELSNDEQQNN